MEQIPFTIYESIKYTDYRMHEFSRCRREVALKIDSEHESVYVLGPNQKVYFYTEAQLSKIANDQDVEPMIAPAGSIVKVAKIANYWRLEGVSIPKTSSYQLSAT